jgi:hypothetical protein
VKSGPETPDYSGLNLNIVKHLLYLPSSEGEADKMIAGTGYD